MFLDLNVDQKSRIKMMLKSYVRKFHDCFRRGLNLLIFFQNVRLFGAEASRHVDRMHPKKIDRISVNKANG